MIKKDIDVLILEELKTQNIDGLTDRGKLAIRELTELNEGAVIFLILSLNSVLGIWKSHLINLNTILQFIKINIVRNTNEYKST